MSPAFWQLLLTAELPFIRRESIVARASRLPPNSDWARFFAQAPELTPADRARLAGCRPERAESALAQGAVLIARSGLPPRLSHLMGTPHALFLHGEADSLEAPTVGIVGTRAASTYGKAVARSFSEVLAQAGVTIVSGGAQGIDASAHLGALDAGGRTVAVLACGIDRVYPAAHAELFGRIRRSGCLASQFPVGWNPRNDSFVHRNATIAALSDALLVVEAPERSGALSTANRANEYGRPIFVAPGPVTMKNFEGSHNLIRDGATLVHQANQILEEMNIAPGVRRQPELEKSAAEDSILNALGAEPLAVDKIAELSGLDPSALLSELTLLELSGRVIRGPGGYILAP